MITNERQYRITKAELKRFGDALAALKASGPRPDVHPRIHQAMIEANESQRDELREELERYDDLRSGHVAQRTLHSLRELPIALIEARIAARLTQKELAKRLGVPEPGGTTFLEFFQHDRVTGEPKGIVAIDLEAWA